MNDEKLAIVATVVLLLEAGVIAAGPETREVPDATSASVAVLKANLGNAANVEIDEVRITEGGVACIEYRVSNGSGSKVLGHAVVQGDQVLKSPANGAQFEKAWNDHCLGPRGGMTSDQ